MVTKESIMRMAVLLKRILFWLESSISFVIVLIGIAILGWVVAAGLIQGDMRGWMQQVGEIAGYYVEPSIRIVTTEPLIALSTTFWVGTYIGTMMYFAQTEREKRIGKYLIPLTLVSLPICAILGFTMAIAGLASQGAGH